MITASEIDVTLETLPLRQAIQAVAPHAFEDAEWTRLHRCRLSISRDQATLVATNGNSLAIALVPVVEHNGFDLGCIDIAPTDFREISRLFKPSKEDADSGSAALRFQVTDKELTVTDVGGMFPGKSLTLNGLPIDELFPDVGRVLLSAQLRAFGFVPAQGYRAVVSSRLLRKFNAAADAYDSILHIEPTGPAAALMVTCGPAFFGALMPIRQDDDDNKRHADLRSEWTDLFNELSRNHPRPQTLSAEPVEETTSEDLIDLLLGPDGGGKPVKGGKVKPAPAADDEQLEPDDPDDELEPEPAEVESVPMFSEADLAAAALERLAAGPSVADDLLIAVQSIAYCFTTSIRSLRLLFKCGHDRAERVMNLLEGFGFVGPAEVGQPRRVLVTPEGLPAAIESINSAHRRGGELDV